MVRMAVALSVFLVVLGGIGIERANAALPADFPAITTSVYDADAIGAGYIYLAVAGEVEGIGSYLMIVDNDGTPVWYKELADQCAHDFKMQPNGLLTYAQLLERHSYTDGGDAVHMVMDEDFAEIDTFQMANGYIADTHDFQWLPNGHALLLGYYLTPIDPATSLSGAVIQELDADRNVVFQWRTWDHAQIDDHVADTANAGPVVGDSHLNAISVDMDGDLFMATSQWVEKASRRTGEILWRLGGDQNEFTFVGVDPDEAAGHFGGYAFHRLDNGNVLIYDGGDVEGTRTSQVHEYKLDEQNKIAEWVWTYTPDPGVYGWRGGNAQRLPNGNTFIGWGDDGNRAGPACTEVMPDEQKVFELSFDNPRVESYRAFRLPLPDDISKVGVTKQYVGIGSNEFKRGALDTGVTIHINGYTGTGYNVMGVVRTPLAPLYPTFEGQAPRVVPVRLQVGANGINTIDARISLHAQSFQLGDPENYTIYRRDPKESKPFVPLPTSYDATSGQLSAEMTDFGEFIVGRPDVELMTPEPF